MADGDDGSFLEFNADPAIEAVTRLTKALGGLNVSMEKITGTGATYNSDGERVLATVKAQGREFGQLKTVFAQVEGELQVLTTTIKDFAKVQGLMSGDLLKRKVTANFADAQKREREAIATRKKLLEDFSKNKATPSTAEMGKLEAPIDRLAAAISKGKFNAEQLNDVFTRMQAGVTRFTTAERLIVNQLNAAKVAADNFGNASAAAQAKATAETNKNLAAHRALRQEQLAQATANRASRTRETDSGVVRRQFGANTLPTAGTASTRELNNYNLAVEKIASAVAKGKFSLQELNDTFAKLSSGSGTTFTTKEAEIVSLLIKADQVAKRFGDSAAAAMKRSTDAATANAAAIKKAADALESQKNKAIRQNTNNSNADTAGQQATALYGRNLSSANPQQILAFNAALQSSLKLLRDGKVSLSDFNAVLSRVRAGTIKTELNPALSELQQKLMGLNTAFQQVGGQGASSGGQIFLSWQNVVRIFESQVLYSVFNKIQGSFAGATEAAAAYSKQIGLIQTISQDANISTLQWSTGLRQVSDSLGLDLVDTAGAAYEALSNQVAKGADAFQFLSSAGQFAKTTNSSMIDSVNLLSSALNSFYLDTSQAERVAKSFFTTIDLGRVKASELANSYGRTGALASSLGVQFEEVNAAISSLTRQGIKANEAFTLINNLFQKLIKPTDAMKALYAELNVATGEQAIEQFGLTGVLEILDKKFAGSAATASKYFDEIRGGRAALALTGEGLKQFKSDLGQNLDGGSNYANAKNIVNQTFGQQFESEINKIKNFFTVDVGGTFLTSIVQLTNKFGGLNNAVQTLVGLAKILAPILAAAYATNRIFLMVQALGTVNTLLVAHNAAVLTGVARWASFARVGTAALGAVGLGVGALIAIVAGLAILQTEISNKIEQELRGLSDAFRAESLKQAQIEQEGADKRYKAFSDGLTKSKTIFLRFASELRGGLTRVSEGLRADFEKITNELKSQLDVMANLSRQSLNEMENKLRKGADDLKDVREAIRSAPEEYNKGLFSRNLDKNALNVEHGGRDQELALYQQRINELDKKAKFQLFDLKNLKAAEATFSEIDQLYDDLVTKKRKVPIFDDGKKVGEVEVLKYPDAEKFAADQVARKVALEKQYQVLLEQHTRELEAQKNKQQQLFELYQEQSKNLLKFDPLDKKGDLKQEYSGDDGAIKAAQDLKKAQDEVLDTLTKIGAGIDSQIHTRAEFAKQEARLAEILDSERKSVIDQVTAKVQIEQTDKAYEGIARNFSEAATQAGKLNEQQAENIRQIQEFRDIARDANAAIGLQAGNKGFLTEGVQAFNPFADRRLAGIKQLEARGPITDAANQLDKALSSPVVNAQTINDAKIAWDKLAKAIEAANKAYKVNNPEDAFSQLPTGKAPGPGQSAPTIVSDLEKIRVQIERLQGKLSEAETIKLNLSQVQKDREEIEKQAGRIGLTLKDLGKDAITAGKDVATGLHPAIEAANKIKEALDGAVNKLGELQKLKDRVGPLPEGKPVVPEVEPKPIDEAALSKEQMILTLTGLMGPVGEGREPFALDHGGGGDGAIFNAAVFNNAVFNGAIFNGAIFKDVVLPAQAGAGAGVPEQFRAVERLVNARNAEAETKARQQAAPQARPDGRIPFTLQLGPNDKIIAPGRGPDAKKEVAPPVDVEKFLAEIANETQEQKEARWSKDLETYIGQDKGRADAIDRFLDERDSFKVNGGVNPASIAQTPHPEMDLTDFIPEVKRSVEDLIVAFKRTLDDPNHQMDPSPDAMGLARRGIDPWSVLSDAQKKEMVRQGLGSSINDGTGLAGKARWAKGSADLGRDEQHPYERMMQSRGITGDAHYGADGKGRDLEQEASVANLKRDYDLMLELKAKQQEYDARQIRTQQLQQVPSPGRAGNDTANQAAQQEIEATRKKMLLSGEVNATEEEYYREREATAQQAIDALKVIPDTTNDEIQAAENQVGNQVDTSTRAVDSLLNVVESGFENAASRLSAQLSAIGSSGTASAPGYSRGGRVGYFAQGGFMDDFLSGKMARGTDTQPAMLTRGEYVMDAKNTGRFLPILRSMSAGHYPQQSTSNNSSTNVGDINITVQGGNSAPQTIKAIGAGLRRGIRQGNIKL